MSTTNDGSFGAFKDLEHPPDVQKAIQTSVGEYNGSLTEEELAVITVWLMFDANQSREEIDEFLMNNGSRKHHQLFCDLEYAKKLGNEAFAGKRWLEALQYYCSILESIGSFGRDPWRWESLESVNALLVSVHANLALLFLKLARQKEAAHECIQALKLPILFDKKQLHRKVLFRLELTSQPPTEEALAAKAAIQDMEIPAFIVSEKDLAFLISMTGYEDHYSPAERRAIAILALEIVHNSGALAAATISICSDGANLGPEFAFRSIQKHALDKGIYQEISQEKVEELRALLGKTNTIASEEAKLKAQKDIGREMLQEVRYRCEHELYSFLLQKYPNQAQAVLSQPRAWLQTHDIISAISYFLAAADSLVKDFDDNKVAKTTIERYKNGNQQGATSDARYEVEITWLAYVKAVGAYDNDKSYGKWKYVEFERARYQMRILDEGLLEPQKLVEPGLRQAVSEAATATPVATGTGGTNAAVTKIQSPSLADTCAHQIEHQFQLVATKRGIDKLYTAQEEAKDDDTDSFDPYRWALHRKLNSRMQLLKQQYLPVVDELWHVCVQRACGSVSLFETLPLSQVKQYHPARVFVSNRPVKCPTREESFNAMHRALLLEESPPLPKSAIAVRHYSEEGTRTSRQQVDLFRQVLMDAVADRGGRPRRVALGPIGLMEFYHEFHNSRWLGTDEVPRDIEALDLSEQEFELFGHSRTTMEAFLEDVLQVEEHWLEGWHTRQDVRPKKMTPAEIRAKQIQDYRKRCR